MNDELDTSATAVNNIRRVQQDYNRRYIRVSGWVGGGWVGIRWLRPKEARLHVTPDAATLGSCLPARRC